MGKVFEAVVDDRIPGVTFITREPKPVDGGISVEVNPITRRVVVERVSEKPVVINGVFQDMWEDNGRSYFAEKGNCWYCMNRVGIKSGNRMCTICLRASLDGCPTR